MFLTPAGMIMHMKCGFRIIIQKDDGDKKAQWMAEEIIAKSPQGPLTIWHTPNLCEPK